MNDVWSDMIRDLYDNDTFTEICYIEGFETKCFCSPITNNLVYTEAGLQDDCNFVLDVMIEKLDHYPKEGEEIVFRNKTYKIASTEVDSANVCVKLYLISTSQGA